MNEGSGWVILWFLCLMVALCWVILMKSCYVFMLMVMVCEQYFMNNGFWVLMIF